MTYRIRIDMMFDDFDPANDILEECMRHEEQAITINPGQPNKEHSSIVADDCTHDVDPATPCIPTYQWQSP